MKSALVVLVSLGCCILWEISVASGGPPADSSAAPGRPLEGQTRGEQRLSLSARLRQAAKRAGELRRQMHARLRQEATTEGPENLRAVENLIDMYITLRLDDSLGDYERRRLAGTVRSRLLRVRERLAREQKRSETAAKDSASDQSLLATRAHATPSGAQDDDAASRVAARAGRRAAESVAQVSQLVLAQQGALGPAGQAAAGALAAAPPFAGDYGPDLADLIQTVIAPSTWERNGGPGTIYYYRPLRVLVIRQTGEVHNQIGGTLDALRRAGN